MQLTVSTLYAITSDSTIYIPLGAAKTTLDMQPEDCLDIILTGNCREVLRQKANRFGPSVH